MITITCRTLSVLLVTTLLFPAVGILAQDFATNDVDSLIEATIELLVDSAGDEDLTPEKKNKIVSNIAQLKVTKAATFGALLGFSPKPTYSRGNGKRAMVMLRKKLDISPQDILEYVLPELEKESCDRERLYALVASVSDPTGEWFDTRFSSEFLLSQRDCLHAPFVQHIYAVYPKKGIIRLIDSCITDADRKVSLLRSAKNIVDHSQMDMLLQGKTIDDDIVQSVVGDLTTLAQSEEWWIRYFVARSLRYAPAYREDHLLAGLKNDIHPLVREVVKSAKASR